MRLAPRALALAVAAATTGCIVPLGIPATRVDGGYSPQGDGSLRVGTHVVGYRLDAKAEWDFGAGYARTATTYDPMVSAASGFYLEGAYLRRLDGPARLSVGPGISMLFRGDRDELLPVAYLRAGVEMFAPIKASGTSSERCGSTAGTWFGQIGLGAYVDVQKPVTESGMAVVIGVSGRLPAFGGIAIVIPYCK